METADALKLFRTMSGCIDDINDKKLVEMYNGNPLLIAKLVL